MNRALLVMIAVLAVACGDSTGTSEATYETATASLPIWAINGTPYDYPSGLILAAAGTTTFEPFAIRFNEGAFDLAFDITDDGGVRIYPAKLISDFAEYSVGLRLLTGTFDSITRAPGNRYTIDSALVVQPGQVVAIQAEAAICASSSITYIYAMLVVESIALADRRINLRVTVNPNCGYRSLLPGYPTS